VGLGRPHGNKGIQNCWRRDRHSQSSIRRNPSIERTIHADEQPVLQDPRLYRTLPLLPIRQTIPHGIERQLQPVIHLEFLKNVAEVSFHRLLADEELGRNFLVTVPRSN